MGRNQFPVVYTNTFITPVFPEERLVVLQGFSFENRTQALSDQLSNFVTSEGFRSECYC